MPVKVLLADDNITAQRMGSKILADAGYAVVPVSNGAAAVKKIASERPEIIILDVYMPGYTGLEVCEKVKSARETARVPVLLTVTNMEPFNPEDGNRVKADGVLIKPFEPTDLLAVLRKFEEKLRPVAVPEAETTTKMQAVEEFSGQDHAEWKTEAESGAKPPQMPHEVASAPLLGIDDLTTGETSAFAIGSSPVSFSVESPSVAPSFDLGAPALELQHAEPEAPPPMIAPPPELEITSAPKAAEVDVAPAPELEITAQESVPEVTIVQEPALATDPSDFAQFVTKFGEEHPEEVPVGIAMEEPSSQGGVLAEIHEVVAEPAPSSFEQEMRQAFEIPAVEIPESEIRTAEVHALEIVEAEVPAAEKHDVEIPAAEVPAAEFHEIESPALEISAAEMHALEVPAVEIAQIRAITAVAPAYEAAPDPEVGMDTQPLDIFPEEARAMPPEVEPVLEPEQPEAIAQLEPEQPEADTQAEPEHPEVNTQKLVAQFAAELDAAAQHEVQPESMPDMEPPAAAATAPALDQQRVAEAVQRVLDRYRGDIVAAILRELEP